VGVNFTLHNIELDLKFSASNDTNPIQIYILLDLLLSLAIKRFIVF